MPIWFWGREKATTFNDPSVDQNYFDTKMGDGSTALVGQMFVPVKNVPITKMETEIESQKVSQAGNAPSAAMKRQVRDHRRHSVPTLLTSSAAPDDTEPPASTMALRLLGYSPRKHYTAASGDAEGSNNGNMKPPLPSGSSASHSPAGHALMAQVVQVQHAVQALRKDPAGSYNLSTKNSSSAEEDALAAATSARGGKGGKSNRGALDPTTQLRALQRELQCLRMDTEVLAGDLESGLGQANAALGAVARPLLMAMQMQQQEYEQLQHRFSVESRVRAELYNRVMEHNGNIRVFCRWRPLLPGQRETALLLNPSNHMEFTHTSGGVSRKFAYDRVYGPEASQSDIFRDCEPVVTSVLDGFNVTIFAYGQTGSGKTYTIWGPPEPLASNDDERRGVNFRTLERLFQLAGERAHTVEHHFALSMLEVYNDQIRDLLCPGGKLEVRQSREEAGALEVEGLSEETCQGGIQQVMDLFRRGNHNRATASTALNSDSSRSHSLLRVRLTSRNKVTGESWTSKLWLVDLAGSERVGRSEAQGDRLKEAQYINKSLSALGDCVAALGAKQQHVPFRNSKLTTLLQDSLGGNSKTLMYIQVSPWVEDAGETLCSLNFASRVKGVDLGSGSSRRGSCSSNLDLKFRLDLQHARLAAKEANQQMEEVSRSAAQAHDEARQLRGRAEVAEQRVQDLEEEVNQLRGQHCQNHIQTLDAEPADSRGELERLRAALSESQDRERRLEASVAQSEDRKRQPEARVAQSEDRKRQPEASVAQSEDRRRQPEVRVAQSEDRKRQLEARLEVAPLVRPQWSEDPHEAPQGSPSGSPHLIQPGQVVHYQAHKAGVSGSRRVLPQEEEGHVAETCHPSKIRKSLDRKSSSSSNSNSSDPFLIKTEGNTSKARRSSMGVSKRLKDSDVHTNAKLKVEADKSRGSGRKGSVSKQIDPSGWNNNWNSKVF